MKRFPNIQTGSDLFLGNKKNASGKNNPTHNELIPKHLPSGKGKNIWRLPIPQRRNLDPEWKLREKVRPAEKLYEFGEKIIRAPLLSVLSLEFQIRIPRENSGLIETPFFHLPLVGLVDHFLEADNWLQPRYLWPMFGKYSQWIC